MYPILVDGKNLVDLTDNLAIERVYKVIAKDHGKDMIIAGMDVVRGHMVAQRLHFMMVEYEVKEVSHEMRDRAIQGLEKLTRFEQFCAELEKIAKKRDVPDLPAATKALYQKYMRT